MSVDHRPLLERKARGILVRAWLGIVACTVFGGVVAAGLVLHYTAPPTLKET